MESNIFSYPSIDYNREGACLKETARFFCSVTGMGREKESSSTHFSSLDIADVGLSVLLCDGESWVALVGELLHVFFN